MKFIKIVLLLQEILICNESIHFDSIYYFSSASLHFVRRGEGKSQLYVVRLRG